MFLIHEVRRHDVRLTDEVEELTVKIGAAVGMEGLCPLDQSLYNSHEAAPAVATAAQTS